MAFTDPQTITINTVGNSCARVKSDGTRTEYAKSDGELKFTISHQDTKSRYRRMMRLDQRVVAENPLTAENEYKNLAVYMVIDQPEYGFDAADIDYLVQALSDWLTTANVLKVLGGEH